MPGSFILVILIIASSLPAIAVYIWFRFAKYQLTLVQFLSALLAGAAAFFPALIFQDFLNIPFSAGGRGPFFYQFFIRIALTEELSRFLVLLIFFWISSNKHGIDKSEYNLSRNLTFNIVKKATAIGLVAGFGFAILESARYAAVQMDISILLLRIFTAALHGACGSRIGAAVVMFRSSPVQAILRIITAIAIHGIYNMMLTMPGFSPIAAYLIAVSALITAIMTIRGGWTSNAALHNTLDNTLDKNKEN
ncbi:MAG: PrsW family glutamic-type intramembrane protease [Treponema sp.]|nr:PrsW family glutamic-type intramembrane protease [Treponema sp.]